MDDNVWGTPISRNPTKIPCPSWNITKHFHHSSGWKPRVFFQVSDAACSGSRWTRWRPYTARPWKPESGPPWTPLNGHDHTRLLHEKNTKHLVNRHEPPSRYNTIWWFPELGVPLSSSMFIGCLPLKTIQLLAYTIPQTDLREVGGHCTVYQIAQNGKNAGARAQTWALRSTHPVGTNGWMIQYDTYVCTYLHMHRKYVYIYMYKYIPIYFLGDVENKTS